MTTKKTATAVNEEALKAGVDAVQQGYEQAIAATREQVEKFAPGATKGFEELSVFGKQNMEAAVAISTIAAKGFEILGKEIAAYNQKALEAGVANTKTLMGAKTFQEAVELQTGFARQGLDDLVAEGTKLSELSLKVAQDTAGPLNARVNAAVEKFGKPLAA